MITDEGLKAAAQILADAIRAISIPAPVPDPGTPPPVPSVRSIYQVEENDANPNGVVKIFKSPDTNETNQETLWAKLNRVVIYENWRDIPGHPVWNAMSELDRINTYRDWRAIDCSRSFELNGQPVTGTVAITAGGKAYAFPEKIRYNQEPVVPLVVWILKADLGAKVG